jgi:pantoate--beta-alanine ligase
LEGRIQSMKIAKTVSELRHIMKEWRSLRATVAFVPTMGNLHEGHLKLVEEARNRADKTVISIFVNPTQFGPGEDFEHYPRTETQDLDKLSVAGTDLVFLPGVDDMYAPGAKTAVIVAGLSDIYCGHFRPGHFSGVATVVCKLFNMVKPDYALFGMKDFQQLAVIKAMVQDLNIDLTLIGIDTVREADGLALSSRNGYLTLSERQKAPLLYQTLTQAKAQVLAGDGDFKKIEAHSMAYLKQSGFEPDYFSISRSNDLQPADLQDRDLVILTAARMGKTRLIDNIVFSVEKTGNDAFNPA